MSQEAEMIQEDVVPQCRVAAVVPAAGCGERMAHSVPKQYLPVSGRPLVIHCLTALQEVPWVARVVVVADDLARMLGVVQQARLSKVTVIQVVVAAERYGVAGTVRPLVSTVVKPDPKGFLEESLTRTHYRNSEMPQAFRFDVLREAYRRCSEDELDHGTECLALAFHHAGIRAKLVPGTPHLWKVTEERDLVVARTLLPRHHRRIAVICKALTMPYTHPDKLTRDAEATIGGTSLHHGVRVELQTPISDDHSSINQTESSFAKTNYIPHTSVPLVCGSECIHVFKCLESSLRKNSQHVYLSSDFNITSTSSSTVVVVTTLGSLEEFEQCTKRIAEELNRNISSLVLIFTLRTAECNVTLPNVQILQQTLKLMFNKHMANVTVLIRFPSQNFSFQAKDSGCEKEQTISVESDITCYQGSTTELEQCDERGQLVNLVATLLDQTTRCFHGQVLVL
ncbi:uncharacterized protein LOC121869979 isoform X2 [Homarus americanus]|uniref:uncharacterized protein LOC121869979 isoform X2 n=1 Tax=Homarus americanus TaxID=6706 RepID=UPI001C477EC3|nr:uncharacterized protein LOC121869979 isoform X2 [Homarus americanus]